MYEMLSGKHPFYIPGHDYATALKNVEYKFSNGFTE